MACEVWGARGVGGKTDGERVQRREGVSVRIAARGAAWVAWAA